MVKGLVRGVGGLTIKRGRAWLLPAAALIFSLLVWLGGAAPVAAQGASSIGPVAGQNAQPGAQSDRPEPLAAPPQTGTSIGPVSGSGGQPGSVAISIGASGDGQAPAQGAPQPKPQTQTASAKPGPLANLGPVRADPNRLWTVAVYMDGDNNLEPFALKDLAEMAGAMPGRGLEVIVLVDRAEGYSDAAGDWKGARVYRLIKGADGKGQGERLAELGEINMGDPAVLQSFLTAVLKTFPAKRHALVMWNHGGGWAGHATDDKAPGKPNEFDKLTLPELRQALSGSLATVGRPGLDLIGFDMCLMAQLETAFELEGLARVMVGSEAVEPGDGWPYDQIIPLFARADLSTKAVAQGIVDAYGRFYQAKQEPIATQSALDLTRVGGFVQAFDAFLARLEPDLPRVWPAFTRTLFFSDGYSDLADVRKGAGALLSVDLGDALKNLVEVSPELAQAQEYAAFTAALKSLVIDRRESPKHRRSQGLSIYAPFRPDLLNKDYRFTRFAQKSRWVPTLARLYELQEKSATRPKIGGIQTYSLLRNKPVPDVLQLGQDGFVFEFDGTNVLWSFAFLGAPDRKKPRTLIFQKSILRHQPKEESLTVESQDRQALLKAYSYPDGPHRVGFRYDGSWKRVSNGEKSLPATIDESDVNNLGSFLTMVPAVVEHPQAGKLFCEIYFNWLWRAAAVIAQVPQKDGSYVKTRIKPGPETTVHLLLETVTADGKRSYASSGSLKWKDGLHLVMDLVPPGEYSVSLAVESLSGHQAAADHKFVLKARDDLKDLLKAAPDELILDNFVGQWEFIDAQTWFKQGRMASLGAFATYERHPKMKTVLRLTLEKPKGHNVYPNEEIVEVVQAGGLPIMRQFVIDKEGAPKPDYGYRLSLPLWDQKNGQYLMLSMDLATGEMQVKVKRSGPRPRLKPVAAQAQTGQTQSGQGQAASQPQPSGGGQASAPQSGRAGLDGGWASADGEGLAFKGNQWAYYEGGQMTDGGVFQIKGDRITARSQASGAVMEFRFRLSDNRLTLQDSFGEVTVFTRVK